jgi:hypothetical protein
MRARATITAIALLAVAVSPAGAIAPLGPQYGKTFDVSVVRGSVRFHVPGSTEFHTLEGRRRLPVGAILDADRGRLRMTSAKTRDSSSLQTAEFFAGTFRVLQTVGGRPITVLKLENAVVCPGRPGTAAPRSANRGLWGSGEGNFRTVGKHGSATVRGTIWWAQDTCKGTFFRVKRGVATIAVFSTGQMLKLHAGERYLAPNG